MAKTKSKYFHVARIFLLYGGNSLDEESGLLYKIYSIIILVFCNIYPLLVWYDLSTQNFNDALNGWFYTSCAAYDSSIAVSGFMGRKPLGILMKRLEQPPFAANKDRGDKVQESKMLDEWSSFFKKQTFLLIFGAFIIISYRVIFSSVKRVVYSEMILPWSPITLINASYSPNYEILWMWQNTVFLYYCFTTIPLVIIICGCLSMMSVQFRILHCYLRRIVKLSADTKDASFEENGEVCWTALNSHIKRAVTYHLQIYKTVEEIDSLFGVSFLSVFLITLVLICFDIYQASLMPNFNLKQIFLLMEILTVFAAALMYCYYGEQLTHESERIGQVAYELDFIGVDLRLQKSLMMIIRQSQKPLKIKAGNMIEGSMAVVVWILRSSFSAYMMLRTLNTPQVEAQIRN